MAVILSPENEAFQTAFREIFESSHHSYASYTQMNFDYSKIYFGDIFEDLSRIVVINDKPIAALRLTRSKNDHQRFTCFERPIFFIFSHLASDESKKTASSELRKYLDEVLTQFPQGEFWFRERSPHLTVVADELLRHGAKTSPYFSQLIDLNLSEEVLWQQVRKSYKSLVNWGKKNLKTVLFNAENIQAEHLSQFQHLHIEVVGRETRGQKTWDLQLEMIKKQEAFLVLSYLEDQLVSGAMFNYSKNHCLYSVSASKRELFEKPLLHVGMWTAVTYAKKCGCQVFELNDLAYWANEGDLQAKKLVDISTFKKGFGGNTQYQLDLLLKK